MGPKINVEQDDPKKGGEKRGSGEVVSDDGSEEVTATPKTKTTSILHTLAPKVLFAYHLSQFLLWFYIFS